MTPTVVIFLRVPVELREQLGRVAVRRFKSGNLVDGRRMPSVQSEGLRLLAAAVTAELAAPAGDPDQLDLQFTQTVSAESAVVTGEDAARFVESASSPEALSAAEDERNALARERVTAYKRAAKKPTKKKPAKKKPAKKKPAKVPRSCPCRDGVTGKNCGRAVGHGGLHANGARRWRSSTTKKGRKA